MRADPLFSVGVEQLLHRLRPHGQQKSWFPEKLAQKVETRRKDEATAVWFRRIVEATCESDPRRAEIDARIALFAELRWKKDKDKNLCVDYANIQVLAAAREIVDYYIEPDDEAVYLRLDFDYKSLGDPFSHPLIHLHVDGCETPRFGFELGYSGNLIVDFVEFLFRHFAYDSWEEWARVVWEAHLAKRNIAADTDPLPDVWKAFRAGEFEYLSSNRRVVLDIKHALQDRKDERFPYRVDASDVELIEYPPRRSRS